RGDRDDGGQRTAPARIDGVSAAQPVPDEHLRERGLRAARGARLRTAPQAAIAPRAGAGGGRGVAARRAVRRGGSRPRPSCTAPVGRPAAAAVQRARAGGATRGAAARRAVLGAGPDLHGDDRAADRGAARGRGDRDRDAQPAAGDARRRSRRVHAPRRARGVRSEHANVRRPAQPAHARLRGRSVRVRAAAVLPALLALGVLVALSGCETTAEKSAKLERAAHHAHLAEKGLTIGKQSADVRVLNAIVVHGHEGNAAVLTLRNDSAHALRAAPIAITVRDARGATLFQNNAPGLEAALTSLGSLPDRKSTRL